MRAHIDRSTGKSTPQVVASSGQEWQYKRHHGMYIMGCIWQPLWILYEKVGICFYFLIMRVVISQLAL